MFDMINAEENEENVYNDIDKNNDQLNSKDIHGPSDHNDLKKSRNGIADSTTKLVASRTTAVTTE